MSNISSTSTPTTYDSSSRNQLLGNVGNTLLLVLTSIITVCMLYQWPSADRFDSNWLSNGFCVSNAETFLLNSHSLSFYADTLLAAIIGYLYLTQDKKTTPPLQEAMLGGAVTAVFGHGLGHLYLGLDPTGMDLRLNPEDVPGSMPKTIVNLLAFTAIFKGTMPMATFETLTITALLASAGITLLDAQPKLNFVYAQAAIYVSSAIYMLLLDPKYKSEASYRFYPWMQLPILLVGMTESIFCQRVLEPIGGHVIFDTTIAGGIIAIELMSRPSDGASKKVKSS